MSTHGTPSESPARGATHGLYRLRGLSPSKWPSSLRRLFERRCAELAVLPHLDAQRHKGAIVQTAWLECLCATARQWIAVNGIFGEDGAVRPILKVIGSYENSLTRLYAVMGLTPLADRKVLNTGAADFAALLAGVEDADTEEAGDDDGGASKGDGGDKAPEEARDS